MSVTPVQFAVDAATGDANVRTITFASPSAKGDLILVFIGITGGAASSVVDDLGNRLTFLRDSGSLSGSHHTEVWYYLNPVAGTRTITVTVPGNSHGCTGLSYSGVDQRKPIGLAQSDISQTGATASLAITPGRVGKLVTYGFATGGATSTTVTDGGYAVRNAGSGYVHAEDDIDVTGPAVTTHWSTNGASPAWILWQLVLQERGVPDMTPWGE